MPQTVRVAINDQISKEVVGRFGISANSFDNARILTTTENGPLYVIPGTSGICLALSSTVGCTDDFTGGPVVSAVLIPNASGYFVGGGLLNSDVSVDVLKDTGERIPTVKTKGGFLVTSSMNIVADRNHPVTIVAAN
jgi:hypothetical protein